jgi:hypothetical protein
VQHAQLGPLGGTNRFNLPADRYVLRSAMPYDNDVRALIHRYLQRDGHGIVLVTYRADPAYIIGGFLEVCDILSSLTEVIATRVNVAET